MIIPQSAARFKPEKKKQIPAARMPKLSYLKEVADLLGISQSYISRLEKKIMVRLRKEMVKYS